MVVTHEQGLKAFQSGEPFNTTDDVLGEVEGVEKGLQGGRLEEGMCEGNMEDQGVRGDK